MLQIIFIQNDFYFENLACTDPATLAHQTVVTPFRNQNPIRQRQRIKYKKKKRRRETNTMQHTVDILARLPTA